MDGPIWSHGAEEMALRPWWWMVASSSQRMTSPIDRDAGWKAVDADGFERIRGLLAHGGDLPCKLRQLLRSEGRFDVSRLTDHQIIDQVARMVTDRRWVLLRRTSTTTVPVASTLSGDAVASGNRAPAAGAPIAPRPGPGDLKARDKRTAVAPGPRAPEPVMAHWIEIELVGEDDSPISDEAYEVVLPDRRIVRGRLDASGWARVDGIAGAGTCLVSFPRLDKTAWQAHAASPLAARGNA